MINLFEVISDVHICLKNREVAIQVLRQALEAARFKKIPLVIAGDLNDTKALLRSEYMNDLQRLFDEFGDVIIYIMVGNHDLNNKHADDHSLNFLNYQKNVTVIDQTCYIDFNGVRWGIIPYQKTRSDFEAVVKSWVGRVDNLITHQGYLGAFMGDYVVDESSADPKIMVDFKCVLSGHYHKSQLVGDNIRYFGSPYTVNFGEAKQEKFIWTVSQIEGGAINCEPTMTNARRHVKIEIDESWSGELQPLRPDSIVQVSVKGTREFCRTITQDRMRKDLGCDRVSVVPSVISQSKQRLDPSIASEPLKIIEAYLDSCTTMHNREELMKYLNDSCGELIQSLSTSGRNRFRFGGWGCENFLSFGQANYKNDPAGLVLVEGYDEDLDIHTGVGKSSFLDIPCFSIFGKTSKNLKVDEFINRKVKKNMYVWSLVENLSDGSCIKIHRYRKHKDHENDLWAELPDGSQLRGKDNIETQKLIEEYLGISFETFMVSTYFTQFGSMDRFLSAPDAEKKRIIFEIQDTKFIDQMLVLIKEKLKRDVLAYDIHCSDLVKTESKIEEAKNSHTNAINSVNSFEAEKVQKLAGIKIAVDNFEAQRNQQLNDLVESQNGFEQNRQAKLNAWDLDCQSFENQRQQRIVGLNNQHNDFENTETFRLQNMEGRLVQLDKHLKDRRSILSDLVSLKDPGFDSNKHHGETLLQQLAKLESEIDQHRFKANDYCSQAGVKREEYKGISERSAEATCGHCFQSISGDAIQKRLVEICSEGEKLTEMQKFHLDAVKERSEDLPNEVEIRKNLEGNEQCRQRFNRDVAQIPAVEREIQVICQEADGIKVGLQNRQVGPFMGQIDGVKAELNPHAGRDEMIKSEANPYPQQIQAKQAEANPYSSNYQQVQVEVNPHQQSVDVAAARVRDLSGAYKESVHANQEMQITTDIGKWWKEALHVYIKSYLSDSFLMQVSDIANHYLDDLFDGILKIEISTQKEVGKGKAKKLKEEIEITIYNGNHECSYESLSGAERNKVCLCVNIAAAKVSQMTTGKSYPFLMLDESLNKNLEARDMAQVMRLLKELELEYETIFVVDHSTEFKQMFTNSLLIKKSAELSTISH